MSGTAHRSEIDRSRLNGWLDELSSPPLTGAGIGCPFENREKIRKSHGQEVGRKGKAWLSVLA
jgi:hypothetical protein